MSDWSIDLLDKFTDWKSKYERAMDLNAKLLLENGTLKNNLLAAQEEIRRLKNASVADK